MLEIALATASSGKSEWGTLFAAALSGGLVAKALDWIFSLIKDWLKDRKSITAIVDAHLDPLLKAADSVVGKTLSLAERDFQFPGYKLKLSTPSGGCMDIDSDIVGLAYLYARLWGRILILGEESLGKSLASDKRGARLQQFIACLGSPKIRLVNRTQQNAIGEITTELLPAGGLRTIGLVEFGTKVSTGEAAGIWCAPLFSLLDKTKQTEVRQQLLVYGVVLHALVDTLDPKHQSTHPRQSYPNKLSEKSKATIGSLVFGEYLNHVGAVNKYTRDT